MKLHREFATRNNALRLPYGCGSWIAEATIEGQTYSARARHGAPNEVVRQLVAAGFAISRW